MIGYAYEMIAAGKQTLMLAGGAEELSGPAVAVFDTLYATSTRNDEPHLTPRPFDVARDGLVVGEGAATLVPKEYEHALARGARIHAGVIGFGCNSDCAHMTQPSADTMAFAMQLALRDAQLPAAAIVYVNAHGTSTDRGDVAESHVTAQTFGACLPISSLKSYVGHTLGACGALEAWWTIEMMKCNWYAPTLNLTQVDRKLEHFMGDTARFACHAARKAIHDANLDPSLLRSPRAGTVIGSGTGMLSAYDAAMAIAHARGIEKVPPYAVPQVMGSTTSANVAQVFGLEGMTYSPSSACTTLALAIGQAMQLIQTGRQQIVLAGGSEGLHDNTTMLFDAMVALSRRFNDAPERASRPYDSTRDGFVIASGGGVLVLEALDHALSRGTRIHAELTGFGHCTDGAGMVSRHASGIARAMRGALDEAGTRPSYINTHAPSTPLSDVEELHALCDVFGEDVPLFSSTKGLSGHPLGACGVHEAIYALLMMRDGFVAGTGLIDMPDPRTNGMRSCAHRGP
ncbi:MAG: FIG138576: 3-oxoacyl-[ACP] synthase (EC [uncultured Caballeronia sp.]|nr:MAG: FIG138576: 3-oxoacyl-[ACP] synthase (EC [uncultured Caballeronia sp.]